LRAVFDAGVLRGAEIHAFADQRQIVACADVGGHHTQRLPGLNPRIAIDRGNAGTLLRYRLDAILTVAAGFAIADAGDPGREAPCEAGFFLLVARCRLAGILYRDDRHLAVGGRQRNIVQADDVAAGWIGIGDLGGWLQR